MQKVHGRSIQGFDLHDALCKSNEYLEKYGGHSMAVGLSLKKENINEFKKMFEKIVNQTDITELTPVIYIDSQIAKKDINKKTVEQLKLLEPFGEANKMPIFMYKNLKIDSIRALSDGKHLKLTLKDGNYKLDAIGFNLGNLAEQYQIDDKIDVIGTLEINSFNGADTVQINLKDIRSSY